MEKDRHFYFACPICGYIFINMDSSRPHRRIRCDRCNRPLLVTMKDRHASITYREPLFGTAARLRRT